jgi:hypothetical protein
VKVANRVTSLLTVLGSKQKPATKIGRPTISTPFTANELLECIQELGFQASLRIDEIGEYGDCASITITTEEELEWYLYLGFRGPYFDEYEISTHLLTSENPHLEANNWHKEDHLSVVTVEYDLETGNPEITNGYFTLEQRMMCKLDDFELAEFVELTLRVWEREFAEFLMQIEPDIEVDLD